MHVPRLGRNQQSKVDVRLLCNALQQLLTCEIGRVTIEMLPDVSLLKTFDFYLYGNSEAWHTLVHVCRKWRFVVFGSPRRLNVQLVCTARTSMRKTLGIWPPLHIFIRGWGHPKLDVDNIVAALEHSDRVYGIDSDGRTSADLH
jgi:hypothetical protein